MLASGASIEPLTNSSNYVVVAFGLIGTIGLSFLFGATVIVAVMAVVIVAFAVFIFLPHEGYQWVKRKHELNRVDKEPSLVVEWFKAKKDKICKRIIWE